MIHVLEFIQFWWCVTVICVAINDRGLNHDVIKVRNYNVEENSHGYVEADCFYTLLCFSILEHSFCVRPGVKYTVSCTIVVLCLYCFPSQTKIQILEEDVTKR